ncbi:hypothetical protein KHA80_03150 [Anaerobacillus sp. HL2]|nr:hypothetical protein KHA80_03150 [Anaerobacillus sp. HL2]
MRQMEYLKTLTIIPKQIGATPFHLAALFTDLSYYLENYANPDEPITIKISLQKELNSN